MKESGLEERALQKQKVLTWNHYYKIGTRVLVTRDNGKEFATKTRSQAQLLSEVAVIWLKNIAGCYRLDRVRPLPPPDDLAP